MVKLKYWRVKWRAQRGILNKLKQTLPHTVMLQLYYALVHPLLLHGIIIWEATYPTYLQKLKYLQNRAIRTTVGAHFRDSVNSYYSQLKIGLLQINDLFKIEVAKFIYGSLHNKTFNSFHKYFCKTNNRSRRATRQSSDCNNLNIPRYRTNKLQRCIKYQVVRIWNCIPTNIRTFSLKKLKYTGWSKKNALFCFFSQTFGLEDFALFFRWWRQ